MNDWEEKLNSVLANPQQMEQIMKMARELTAQPEEQPMQNEKADASGIDPALLGSVSHILGQMNKTDSQKENLLRSLKPYLKQSRQQALDKALRLSRLAKAARLAFREFSGGDDSV